MSKGQAVIVAVLSNLECRNLLCGIVWNGIFDIQSKCRTRTIIFINSRYDSKETPSVTYGQLEMPFVAQPVLKIVLMKTTDNHCENREYVGQF